MELAKEGGIHTADLAEVFTDVNKRTIRRDLNNLVGSGLLEAKGKNQ